jgi:hypothetical protein
MSWSDYLNAKANRNAAEPLLPIEKKLIGFSLGLGIALLIILVGLNHFFSATL